MDFLNPNLEEIDGCYYRVNPVDGFSYGKNAENLPYIEFDDIREDEFLGDTLGEEDEEIPNLTGTEDGYFITKFHVARTYLPVLIGKKGSTLQRLEKETKAFIKIPRKDEQGDITVRSKRKESVAAAYRRIQIMVNTARRKQNYTHFISIPLPNEQFKERFHYFKNTVMEVFNSDRGICPELFQTPEKLHLTIDVLTLADNVERNIAIDTLHQCKALFIDPFHLDNPIKIRVQGLEIMNDDPSEVRVLYGKILTENNSLQELVNKVVKFFTKTGLTCAMRDSIKLHATLMNAKFVSLRTGNIERKNDTFDARNILKKFENFEFGNMLVEYLLLSQSHTTDQDGYYETSAGISFHSSEGHF